MNLIPEYHGVRVAAIRPKDSALDIKKGIKSVVRPGYHMEHGWLECGNAFLRFARYKNYRTGHAYPWTLSGIPSHLEPKYHPFLPDKWDHTTAGSVALYRKTMC